MPTIAMVYPRNSHHCWPCEILRCHENWPSLQNCINTMESPFGWWQGKFIECFRCNIMHFQVFFNTWLAVQQNVTFTAIGQINTPTFQQWMDHFDTGTRACQSWLSIPAFIPSLYQLHTPSLAQRSLSEDLNRKICQGSLRVPLPGLLCVPFCFSHDHIDQQNQKTRLNFDVLFVCFSFWIWAPAARCKCGRPFRFSRSIDSGAAARDDGWLQAFPPVSFVKNPRLILIWQLCVEWAPYRRRNRQCLIRRGHQMVPTACQSTPVIFVNCCILAGKRLLEKTF